MGATIIRIRTKAKGGEITKATEIMDEEQSEQHATTPSERIAIREKNGPGTSPCLNAYFPYCLYE